MSVPTDLQALDDDTLRAVRNDRIAIGDGIYRVLEVPYNGIDLRIALTKLMTDLSTDAMEESLRRIARTAENKETDR